MDKSFLYVCRVYVNESPIWEMILFYHFPRVSWIMGTKSVWQCKIGTHIRYESYIYIEGKITKPDEMKTVISLAHNGLMNLFNEMKYEINSIEVQRVKKPGITSSAMKDYCSYSTANANTMQNAAWDTTNNNTNLIKENIKRRFVQWMYTIKACFGLHGYW